METTIRKKEVKKFSWTKAIVDEAIYITKDGREFEKESDAIAHEKILLDKEAFKQKYKQKFIQLDEDYEALYISELTDDIKIELTARYYHLETNQLSVGWNLIHVDDSGDYTHTYCYKLQNMIKDREEEIERLKAIQKEEK